MSSGSDLSQRLHEAEDLLRAIRAGEIDALVVGAQKQVYTLEPPDQSYRLLVERLPQAAATLTAEGDLLACNPLFKDLLARPLAELAGRPLQHAVAPQSQPAFRRLLAEARAHEAAGEVAFVRPDGSTVTAYLGIGALHVGVRGVCLLVLDLTEQRHYHELRRAEERLRIATERLELAQSAGSIATFEWDLDRGAVTWSRNAAALLRAGNPAGHAWPDLALDEDRPRVAAEIDRVLGGQRTLEVEFRVPGPPDEPRWIALRGRIAQDQPRQLAGVAVDVTARKRAEFALREADRRKNEFLETLAHELRNPLASIRNAGHLLAAKAEADPDARYCQRVIERQVQLMARLLDDLGDVARIARGQLDLRLERVRLASVIEDALETCRPLLAERRHTLEVHLPAASIEVDGDPTRLVQVFTNLVHNAAKYTNPGGRIVVRAERSAGQACVSVRDDGIGISADLLPHIFDLFVQGAGSGGAPGGHGIGLALVKGIVELHGGSIEARSAGPGQGSEFVVRLPADAPAP